MKPLVPRREAVRRLGLLAAAAVPTLGIRWRGRGARLEARPARPTKAAPTGLVPLELESDRDGLLYLPPGHRREQPAPLVILLHGAGQRAPELVAAHRDAATRLGRDLVLLATDSREMTWDAIRGDFGPDVVFLDRALRFTFDRCAIDPKRISLAGFSDGASYALSLGRANGDLLTRIVAYSPGFLVDADPVGKPEFFVTHGTDDRILPIDRCSRILVPRLRAAGYQVDYREWPGGHRVPPQFVEDTVTWMTAERGK